MNKILSYLMVMIMSKMVMANVKLRGIELEKLQMVVEKELKRKAVAEAYNYWHGSTMEQLSSTQLASTQSSITQLSSTASGTPPTEETTTEQTADETTGSLTVTPDWSINGTLCKAICEEANNVIVPNCNGSRFEPVYGGRCGCLLEYQCCAETCQRPKNDCKPGSHIAIKVKDCCGCEVFRCDPCPKEPTPTCNWGCQELEQKSDQMNGCYFQSCKTVCPTQPQITCPSCQISKSFKNKTFCDCIQEKCVRDECPPKKQLPVKNCALQKWIKTKCGCDKQIYDTAHYCDAENAAATAGTCSNACFKNVVRKGKGLCGCDKAECVRINEACEQTFTSTKCPNVTMKVSGTTPCGLNREICIKCEDTDPVANKRLTLCDLACNDIITDKDVNGCQLKKCIKKVCPAIPSLPNWCKDYTFKSFKTDKCGCFSWSSVECAYQRYIIRSDKRTWSQAQSICRSLSSRLAIIESHAEDQAVRKLMGSERHWIGGKCEDRGTGTNDYYYWDYGNGRKVTMQQWIISAHTDLRSCPCNPCGISLGQSTYYDDSESIKLPFVCEKY